MTFKAIHASTGALPRRLTESLLWTGGCLDVPFGTEFVHGNFCVYLIKGSDKTILIDPAHPAHRREIERDVRDFLQGRPLDYIFPTHCEFAHMGLLPDLMRIYPDAIAVGMLDDYPLYYPQLAHRMRNVAVGDSLDLGDRRFVFMPSVWRDLKQTLWGFDTKDRTLFVSDAFAYLHHHSAGECDKLITERPLPDLSMIKFFNERALHWTRFTDSQQGNAEIDEMLRRLRPELVATAHGGVIDDLTLMLPRAKEGMDFGTGADRSDRNDVAAARLLRERADRSLAGSADA